MVADVSFISIPGDIGGADCVSLAEEKTSQGRQLGWSGKGWNYYGADCAWCGVPDLWNDASDASSWGNIFYGVARDSGGDFGDCDGGGGGDCGAIFEEIGARNICYNSK